MGWLPLLTGVLVQVVKGSNEKSQKLAASSRIACARPGSAASAPSVDRLFRGKAPRAGRRGRGRPGWSPVTLRRKSLPFLSRSRLGEGVEFGGHAGGLGRTDPLEDLPRRPQAGHRVGGAASGQG